MISEGKISILDNAAFELLYAMESMSLIKLKISRLQDEELPKITQADIEQAMQDPVIKRMGERADKIDWSWLPEGYSPETFTATDVRELRLKERYGI